MGWLWGRSSSLVLGILQPWPFSNLCSPQSSQSWKWVLAPIILYVFERILRVWRAQQKVVVKKVGGAGACSSASSYPWSHRCHSSSLWWP